MIINVPNKCLLAQTRAVNAYLLYFANIAEKEWDFLRLFECANDALVCETCSVFF